MKFCCTLSETITHNGASFLGTNVLSSLHFKVVDQHLNAWCQRLDLLLLDKHDILASLGCKIPWSVEIPVFHGAHRLKDPRAPCVWRLFLRWPFYGCRWGYHCTAKPLFPKNLIFNVMFWGLFNMIICSFSHDASTMRFIFSVPCCKWPRSQIQSCTVGAFR